MNANHGSKFSGAVALTLLISCNGQSPTAPAGQPPTQTPPPTSARMGIVSGNVYAGSSGGCVLGAVVEVMDGAKAGTRATQTGCQTPWDYGDDGYTFRDLPPDINVRLRASKDGYRSKEMTVLATSGAYTQSNFELETN